MKNIFNFFNSSKDKVMKTQNNNTKGWTAKPATEEKKSSTAAKKIHNLIIVDESGSMTSLYGVALEGMNQTLQSIRESAAECPEQPQEVTLITFDTEHYKVHFDSTPADKTKDLGQGDYRPWGGTPLYDAMGKALLSLEAKVKENEAVVVTVITDGYENASCEFSLADIRALVDRLDKAGWMFSYIGANQDSAAVGQTMGISDTLDFNADEESMKAMWEMEREARKNFNRCTRSDNFNVFEQKGKYFKK